MLSGRSGGWLLDRFGSKRVYFWSIFIWSVFTLLQGFVDIFSGFGIIVALFTLRFWLVWRNRLLSRATVASLRHGSCAGEGTAVAIFNSAQYFATVIFAPIMGWLTHEVGWSHVFFFMGRLGIIISFIWLKVIHEPNNHPGVNKKELEYIAEGGALINMDQKDTKAKVPFSVKWGQIKQLLGSRMMIGVYIGQYCINALTYFFITRSRSIWSGARHVDSQSGLCRLGSCSLRLYRRCVGRHHFRLADASYWLLNIAQDADCAGDVAVNGYGVL
ncbi:MFS transporter [Salmonella enterica subsp. enterica serovar Senftenberg]|nr:MFS transporter [Salmonella enterica subsp. enterica serovar Senftenberg]